MTLSAEGYDAVRRRLQERGYLSSPVERFVLLPQIARGSTLRSVLGSGAKAALVVGPFLGALLAAVLAWSERPLERATDLPLLWLYLVLPATVALFVLDLATALGVTLLAGKRGVRSSAADPSRSAAVTGIVALGYLLALWWARAGERPIVEDVLFVLVAIPVVVAIGYLAGLVSLAGTVRRTGEVPARRPGRRGIVVVGALIAGTLALTARGVLFGGPAPHGLVTVRPSGAPGRMVVIGIDGLDGGLVSALAERGALGRLLAALERGATFPLRRIRTAEPAEVWTTIATGLPADVHGVHGAQMDRLPGVGTTLRGAVPLWRAWRLVLPLREVPASRGVRRAPAVWEIAAPEVGTAVVGWWATWPAPADTGSTDTAARYVITDRVLTKILTDSSGDRDAAPSALYARARAGFVAESTRLRAEFDQGFASAPARLVDWAWESFLIDGFACERLLELLADDRVSAAFVYLPGIDILRHRLGTLDEPAATPAMFASMKVLELYAASLDRRLAPLLEPTGSTTVIVADAGRTSGSGREGFVSVRGPWAEPSCVGPPISELDVAPLLLRELGFPASLEMPGRAPEACFAPRDALGTVPSYGRLPPAERRSATSESDPEVLDRLRSLGYLR